MDNYLKIFFIVLFSIAFFSILLLGPALTTKWPDAFVLILIYAFLQITCTIYMIIYTPKSLEARMGNYVSQKGLDRIATPLLWLSLLIWIISNPIDVFYLNLFLPPVVELKYLGLFLFIFSFLMVFLAIVQNEFAAPTVLISNEQKVIDSGLYSIVRHPMYLSFGIWCLGASLWLESYLGCILVLILFPPVLFRIYIEERELINELDGYLEYTKKVKYRLIPYIY